MEMELGKLFIGGISWDTNEERLREYFQTFGEVVEAVIMKDRVTGRGRGFGFIVFADPAVAERVVMEKHIIDGRAVEAKKAVPRDDQNIMNKNNSSIYPSVSNARTKKIFVGGLPSMTTESEFKGYFEQFGTIVDVVVMYDHNTQRPRGFGFITYDSEEAVDQVLQKTFHELNGKMVEVKRAVPKEISPLPSRSPASGYNHNLNRFNSFINGYMQGYSSSTVGGYGLRMDSRSSPVTVGWNGLSPYSPSYGVKFDSNLSLSYGGMANLGPSLSYGRGQNNLYNVIANRYDSAFNYAAGARPNSSILGTSGLNLWDDGNLEDGANSTNPSILTVSGTENSRIDTFGSNGSLWSSSHGPSSGTGFTYNNSSLGYGSGNFGVGGGGIGYGRQTGSIAAVASRSASMGGGYDAGNAHVYETSSIGGDSTWRSSPLDFDNSGCFGFGIGNSIQSVATKNSAGYTLANRLSTTHGAAAAFQYGEMDVKTNL